MILSNRLTVTTRRRPCPPSLLVMRGRHKRVHGSKRASPVLLLPDGTDLKRRMCERIIYRRVDRIVGGSNLHSGLPFSVKENQLKENQGVCRCLRGRRSEKCAPIRGRWSRAELRPCISSLITPTSISGVRTDAAHLDILPQLRNAASTK